MSKKFSATMMAAPEGPATCNQGAGAGAPVRRIEVELGTRSYPILIGPALLERAGDEIAARCPQGRCAIVCDRTVEVHYGGVLRASLASAGLECVTLCAGQGEDAKSFAGFEQLCNAILQLKLERRDVVIAFGGGVVGDLAGFVAASVRRGMNLVQIPTTLLAQIDSSVGGKTAINSAHGKNLIGAFYQPLLVLIDPDTLKSLPLRQLRAGYAELVKYGLINDAGFFAFLEARHAEVFAGGPARIEAIEKACRAKAEIVGCDEREAGMRALLNLGHTFAHAFEAAARFDTSRLVHGEAVAVGLVLAHAFSASLDLCRHDECARLRAHLLATGLPVAPRDIGFGPQDRDALLAFMEQDKKAARGALNMILTHGIGGAFRAADVSRAALSDFLDTQLERI